MELKDAELRKLQDTLSGNPGAGMHSFEKALWAGLSKDLQNNDSSLLLGVSGGADSMALLRGCLGLRVEGLLRVPLAVVTVNHSLRAMSGSDAAFVADYCSRNASGLPCIVKTLPERAVSLLAEERGRGLEDAARHLRYAAFEEAATEYGAKAILLAHTQSDMVETVLYRFLQGSGGGIMDRRSGLYLRPMLGLTRADVLAYLSATDTPFREDATNSDTHFLRNRVRHCLVPVLDDEFPGWQKPVLAGAEKGRDDRTAVLEAARRVAQETGAWPLPSANIAEWRVSRGTFCAWPRAFRREWVYEGLHVLGVKERAPYALVKRIMEGHLPVGTKEWVAEKNGDTLRLRPTRRGEGWRRGG
jgi:tRNA(Ile)-lysidine synthase